MDEQLFAVVACAVEQRVSVSEFIAQCCTNTAWAIATLRCSDEKLLAPLSRVEGKQMSEVDALGSTNTARKFATRLCLNEKQRVSEPIAQGFTNKAWALATRHWVDEKLSAGLSR